MTLAAQQVVLGPRAWAALDHLEASSSPEGRTVARRVRALKPVLLGDCLHGEVVGRSAIPRARRERHGLENLCVEDLPDFWRLLYTVVRLGGRRVIVIVEIVSHKEYSRWFPGRRG